MTNPSYRSFIEQRDQRAVLHNVFKLTDPTAFGGFTPPANQTLNEFRGPRYANPSLLEDAESTDVKFLEWSDSILNGVPVKLLTYQRPVTHQRDKNHDELRTIFFAADDGRILKWIAFLPSNPKKAIAEANYTYSLIEGKVAPQECRMEEFDDLNLESIVVSSYRNFQYLESVDVKRFFLTYFGLAEPDWYTPPRPWWLYSSLAGMGLLVAGALLLKYGKGVWNRN